MSESGTDNTRSQPSDQPLADPQDQTEPIDPKVRIALLLLAGVCLLLAVRHLFFPRIDSTCAAFVGLAAAAIVFPYVQKFKFMNLEFEKVREIARKELAPVSRRVSLIEEQGELPGRKTAPVRAPVTLDFRTLQAQEADTAGADPAAAQTHADDEWSSDPNAGKFGRLAERNGRRLSAKIKPAAGPNSPACEVTLRVESLPGAPELTGRVMFCLHPTFGRRSQYEVPVNQGVAETKITSWGAFTVGVEADNGATKLELDLAKVGGGTDNFYQS